MANSNNVVQLSDANDVEVVKQSSRTLSTYADADRVRLSIEGSNSESDELVLPGPVVELLLNILAEMSQGNAISLVPVHIEMSTQEAANILNVSRPFLVKLLDEGTIKHHKVGSHRRVRFQDVMDYKQKIDQDRSATLDELTATSQEMDMGYD